MIDEKYTVYNVTSIPLSLLGFNGACSCKHKEAISRTLIQLKWVNKYLRAVITLTSYATPLI